MQNAINLDVFFPLKHTPSTGCVSRLPREKASYTCARHISRWLTISNRFQWLAHSAIHFHWVIARGSGPIERLWIARGIRSLWPLGPRGRTSTQPDCTPRTVFSRQCQKTNNRYMIATYVVIFCFLSFFQCVVSWNRKLILHQWQLMLFIITHSAALAVFLLFAIQALAFQPKPFDW